MSRRLRPGRPVLHIGSSASQASLSAADCSTARRMGGAKRYPSRFKTAMGFALGIGRFTPPVNNGFAFQRGTRPFFRFFPGGFGAGPYLLDAGEEQVATMFLVEWQGIVVAQPGSFYPGSDQNPAIEGVAGQQNYRQADQGPISCPQSHGFTPVDAPNRRYCSRAERTLSRIGSRSSDSNWHGSSMASCATLVPAGYSSMHLRMKAVRSLGRMP
jgi:hypothetical protein